MAINKNFGILKADNQLEYAPSYLKTPSGIVMNPPDSYYLEKGYYRVIDEKPDPEEGCYVKFNSYSKNDSEKTIALNYVQIMVPVIRDSVTYSKLKLEMNLFQIGKSQEFDDFIDQTTLSNDIGQTTSLRKFYDQANELKSDNKYFETYLKLAKERLGLE